MPTHHTDSFDLLETSVAAVHDAMANGAVTAEELVERYLARIDAYDDDLNAILTVNDRARDRARDLDAQFERDGFVGPLHGVPTIIKDNHDTHDMPTTAGSTTLADSQPSRDAFIVDQLREAGAIIIAKANLQELSFGVDTISSLGGATRNAYDLEHRPSGSSGGSAAAIAANLGLIGTGTDTCSSNRSPPAFNDLIGVRPTRGLCSRTGLVPLSETQDTPGPIARTVEDAARLLDVMAGYDPEDPVTARGVGQVPDDGYTAHLDADGLDGARIGIARQFFGLQGDADEYEAVSEDDAAAVTSVLEDAIDDLEAAGATVVDPVDVVDTNWLLSARVLAYEFARDFDAYLETLGDDAPQESLAAIVDSGELAPSIEARFEGGEILGTDQDSLDDNTGYLRRLERRRELRDSVLATLADHDLDALLYPPSTVPPVTVDEHQPFEEMNCELSAHTGLPAIVTPAGFTDDGLPVGLELLGRTFAEPRLFELAYAFEQATENRVPPEQFGALELE
ncbi:amidase [Natrialba sp. SSL1]|uniref:amidase n=1 Tax=Natrialba sp. SSL1 TaxID=1869245 RepID=UPI0008F92D82|nr:amidase family protein [Natrialba sp. SSL1]OIB56448.1 amidase [Natrialba sp. SSL1]